MDQAAIDAVVLIASKLFLYGMTVGMIIKMLHPSE
ncbi:MAG: hypothetical protein UZ03_NOB001001878 [Nitrospira sp. OLB3]|nr:MAG: hypothetical protein UZ03_NOB001001878 [Nitrospira sp. OLB3]